MPKRYHNSINEFEHLTEGGLNKSEIDRMATTGVYDEAVSEFIIACGQARDKMNGKHLSLSRIFQVVLALGYRKN